DLRVRRSSEELVHRAALVGLEVAEHDPAQPLDGRDGRDRLGDEREHPARTGVVEQRLVGVDEELVESESRRPDLGDERADAVDAVGDLGDVGHGSAPSVLWTWSSDAVRYETYMSVASSMSRIHRSPPGS